MEQLLPPSHRGSYAVSPLLHLSLTLGENSDSNKTFGRNYSFEGGSGEGGGGVLTVSYLMVSNEPVDSAVTTRGDPATPPL